MAKKKVRQVVTLESSESSYRTTTTKNPRNTTARLELQKYDPTLKKHTLFKEKK
ncbi:MAG: 50S ribosomal protein L33 [Verrucomicrobia bacterium]|jgi:large subunit ribosomal protein L33|nr:50S ribosomal protein L33 [Verrucomicrobiota bacterium]